MGAEYTPIFLFVVVALLITVSFLAITHVLGPQKITPVKQMPYESGMDPIGDAHQRFDVRYYLVAIAFLLFDLELLFLYPWAVAQWSAVPVTITAHPGAPPEVVISDNGVPSAFRGLVFFEVLIFVAILAAAFAYAWRKGVFEWR